MVSNPESGYTISRISEIISGSLTLNAPEYISIQELLTDSRKIIHADSSLFFAIKGSRHDGHRFIADLVKQGVRNFILSDLPAELKKLEANFILVEDPLAALQSLSAHHRSRFHIPVIGITGSNGKTIV